MTYPSQPGSANDPSWPPGPQPEGYLDPAQPGGQPVGKDGGYPAYGYPSYPGYPGYPGYSYPPTPPTNGLAIAAMVLSILGFTSCITGPIGAILGHIAMKQIRERGEGGEGMAKAGIIVGWIVTGLMVLVFAIYVIVIIAAIASESA